MVATFSCRLDGAYKRVVSPDARRIPITLVGSGLYSIGDNPVITISQHEIIKLKMTLFVPADDLQVQYDYFYNSRGVNFVFVLDHKYLEYTTTRDNASVTVHAWFDTVVKYSLSE